MTVNQQIIVVEDHPIFRKGVVDLLTAEPDFEVVGAVGDAESALDLLAHTPATLMIVDISLPGTSGFELAKRAKERFPALMIMALSTHTKQSYVVRMIQSGATGYIAKESAAHKLIEGLRAIVSGGVYLDGQLAPIVGDSFQGDGPSDSSKPNITKREREILALLVEGHSLKEVAAQLDISPKTVEAHRANFMKKLDLHNTIDLVRYALREGIIKPEHWPFQSETKGFP